MSEYERQHQAAGKAPPIFQVSDLNREARNVLEAQLGNVWLEGECSGVSQRGHGAHVYFTLKDRHAAIPAIMFANDLPQASSKIENGRKLRVFGLVTLFPRGGTYQIQVKHAEDAGLGDLLLAFERLKKKLEAESLFDPKHKQAIPAHPRKVALVTSPNGAALQDMLTVFRKAKAPLALTIVPVVVQGNRSAASIVKALQFLNQSDDPVDLILLARGGGSLEDLWSFNEESVARAIHASTIPILTGVGHEIDSTMSDLVADARASTPTAAAERVTRTLRLTEERLHDMRKRLADGLNTRRLHYRHEFSRLQHSFIFQTPAVIIESHRKHLLQQRHRLAAAPVVACRELQQELGQIHQRMERSSERVIRDGRQQLDHAADTLQRELQQQFRQRKQELQQIRSQLRALNPYAVLERGFSMTRTAEGKLVRDAGLLKPGDKIETRFARGSVQADVTDIKPDASPENAV